MFALVSPILLDQRNRNAAWWTAKKAAVLAAVYPDGKPTGQPDTVEEDWGSEIKPSEASSITRLTIAEPGGRSGGSAIYVHICHPVATSTGKCIVFQAGHITPANGWADATDGYCQTDGSSIIRLALAAGHTVACVDMPNYASNPTQAVTINDVLSTCNAHNTNHIPGSCTPAVSWPVDTPSLTRLWTDHPIIAMNWVTTNLGIDTFALVGHSGGASAATLLAAVEDRFSVVHILQGTWITGAGTSSPTEYEMWSASDICLAAQVYENDGLPGLVNVGASIAGTNYVVHIAAEDIYNPDPEVYGDATENWRKWAQRALPWILTATAGTSSISHHGTSGGHSIDSTQAAWVMAHIASNL